MIELLVATCVLLLVMGVVMTALRQSMQQQQTIWNRTEMHSGVRGATELMQQEVGQAGRVGVPLDIVLQGSTPNPAPTNCDPAHPDVSASVPIAVSSTKGLWATAGTAPASYAVISTLDGDNWEETPLWQVITNPDGVTGTISACFSKVHAAGTKVQVLGTFGNGIIPPAPGVVAGFAGIPNGSTATVLKMFGDINGDGNMVYVEYTCDTVAGKLYRTSMAWDSTTKPKVSDSLVLLNNVQPNPGGTACFTYQVTSPIIVQGQPLSFVLDVAITLTVQTQQVDPVTKQFQTETKALLNVSPRNVFNAWELAGAGYTDRIQSTPATITALLGMIPS